MKNHILIQPRVQVLWGTLNLTNPAASESPTFEGIDLTEIGPLVYDVRVSLEDQGQTPTGSMKWNPSGLAFSIYEKCLEKFQDYSIIVTFYYAPPRKRRITFEFYWGGQVETVGSDMDITVKLVSLLDGLINANFYAYVQSDKDEKGISLLDAIDDLHKKFGVSKDLVKMNVSSQRVQSALQNSIVKSNYNDGSTFIEALQNILKVTGYNVFFNNIETPNYVIYGPVSNEPWETFIEGSRVEAITDLPSRFFYFLFPLMFQNFTRAYEWQPPQKSQEISSILSRKVEQKRNAGNDNKSTPDKAKDSNGKQSSLPEGVYQSKAINGVSYTYSKTADYEFGPRNQDLFNKERSAKLSFSVYACPIMMGIKPLDIIIIPQVKDGEFLEDWAVTSVEYQQTSGGVDISIQATRILGLGEMMNKNLYSRIKNIAKGNLTSDDFLNYAWLVNKELTPEEDKPQVSSVSPVSLPSGDIDLSKVNPSLRPLAGLSNQELRKKLDEKWPPVLKSGLPAYNNYVATAAEGEVNFATINDQAFSIYLRYYYGIENPNPEVSNRLDSNILRSSGNKVTVIKGISPQEVTSAYQSYTRGGRTRMLDYYEGIPNGIFKLGVSSYQPNLYPELFKPNSSITQTPVVQPLPQTPQTPQIAPTSTSVPSTTAQPNARDYQSPPEQSGPETLQPRGGKGPGEPVELTPQPPQPPKPAERPLDLTAAAEARKRLDLAFPVPKSPAIGSDGRVNDPLFYVALPEMIKTSSNPELDKSIKFLGNYRLANYSLERIQFWYQVWTTNKKPGREIYLDILQKRGEKAVNEVYIKAKSGG